MAANDYVTEERAIELAQKTKLALDAKQPLAIEITQAAFDALTAFVAGDQYNVLQTDNSIIQYVVGTDLTPRSESAGGLTAQEQAIFDRNLPFAGATIPAGDIVRVDGVDYINSTAGDLPLPAALPDSDFLVYIEPDIENIADLRAYEGSLLWKRLLGRNALGDGLGGLYVFNPADLSAEVTADTASAVYVAPNSDLTGASGAWVYVIENNTLEFMRFNAVGDGVTDDLIAVTEAIEFCKTNGVKLRGGGKTYRVTEFVQPVLAAGDFIDWDDFELFLDVALGGPFV